MVIDKIFTFLDRNMHHVSYKFPGGNDMKTMPLMRNKKSPLSRLRKARTRL
jgi:hypothetical protein